VITGTAEAGSLVRIYADTNNDGMIGVGDSVVGTLQLAPGQTTYSISVPLTVNAANNFLVTSTDVAGNESNPTDVPTITEDSIAPTGLIVSSPSTRSATSGNTTTITGTAEAGSLVQIFDDLNNNGIVDPGETVVGTLQLAPGQTSYSITVPLKPNTVNHFIVTATDASGNRSSATRVPNVVQGNPDAGLPRGVFAGGAETGGQIARLFDEKGNSLLAVQPFAGEFTGVRVASGDVNGDGKVDLIVGSGPGSANLIKVYDGATGKLLFETSVFESTFRGGVYVEAADMNGDGKAELIVSPDVGGGPRVVVLDGTTGAVLANFFGIEDAEFRGGARVAAGDVNNDGVPDLLVAAGFGGGPRIAAYDGAALMKGQFVKLFADIFVFEETLRNGVFITAGDLDGDGFSDLIVGGGPGGGPRVFALSGKGLMTGVRTQLANFFAGDTTLRSGIHVATADLDLDEKADLIVGAGTNTGAGAIVYLGENISSEGTPVSLSEFDAFFNAETNTPFLGGVFVG